MVTSLLIVDDELPLLRNLSSYLKTFDKEFEVFTAPSAEEALAVLKVQQDIDVLLTDVRLPGIDGIELVRRAAIAKPELRVLVMTAFPSVDVQKHAMAAGALRYMEKPLDVKELRQVLLELIETTAGWSGAVGGLDLFDFIQLFVLSGKETALRVRHQHQEGVLVFRDGRMVHAAAGEKKGEEAFFLMATWEGGKFEEVSRSESKHCGPNINTSTNHLMMEAARLRDEARQLGSAKREQRDQLQIENGDRAFMPGLENPEPTKDPKTKEDLVMAIKDHLSKFEEVEGFKGVAVFTANGEMLDGIAKGKVDIKTIGMFANNALLNAQKATDSMGVGRGNMMQIRAPQAVVLMRCLNEATDFAATKEGKAHFHTVVVMEPESNVGMAAMMLDKIQEGIAGEVR